MKTIEELIKEIEESEELKKEFEEIRNKEDASTFLKKYDCSATVDEFEDFIKSLAEGPLSDEDAENVAGGITLDYMEKGHSIKYVESTQKQKILQIREAYKKISEGE